MFSDTDHLLLIITIISIIIMIITIINKIIINIRFRVPILPSIKCPANVHIYKIQLYFNIFPQNYDTFIPGQQSSQIVAEDLNFVTIQVQVRVSPDPKSNSRVQVEFKSKSKSRVQV